MCVAAVALPGVGTTATTWDGCTRAPGRPALPRRRRDPPRRPPARPRPRQSIVLAHETRWRASATGSPYSPAALAQPRATLAVRLRPPQPRPVAARVPATGRSRLRRRRRRRRQARRGGSGARKVFLARRARSAARRCSPPASERPPAGRTASSASPGRPTSPTRSGQRARLHVPVLYLAGRYDIKFAARRAAPLRRDRLDRQDAEDPADEASTGRS